MLLTIGDGTEIITHSFNNYLLAYFVPVPGVILDAGDAIVNKIIMSKTFLLDVLQRDLHVFIYNKKMCLWLSWIVSWNVLGVVLNCCLELCLYAFKNLRFFMNDRFNYLWCPKGWFWSRYLEHFLHSILCQVLPQEPFQIYLSGLRIWSLLDTLIGYPICLLRTTLNFFLLFF